MNLILSIAAGGAVGAVMRHLTILFSHNILGADFPYGTLAVNIIGSFLMVQAMMYGASSVLFSILAIFIGVMIARNFMA